MLPATITPSVASRPDLATYDTIVVAFSGGKDSLACILALLEAGVPKEKIELHHHEVDGREGDGFMDWPSTVAYCRVVAAALGLRILFSWKVGGFKREMLRDQTPTAPTRFETAEHGTMQFGGNSGKLGTRLKFPQVSASLSCRWCSSYLKIDPMAMTLVHGPAYAGRRTLVVTGERAEESPGRALYKTFETHRAHAKKRHVDHWRPVHAWLEDRVWEIIRRNGVVPHPAYYLGWGRLSCMTCVFISPNQWASIRAIAPERFEAIANYETQFGFTIQRKLSVRQLAEKGTPYPAALSGRASEALETSWNGTVLVRPEDWVMPAGAFGENAGPL